VLLALALLGLGLESRRSGQLAGQVEALSAQLAATRAALEAHQNHLDQVRASVAELQLLVERDPVPPPSETP
jgi:uncharacterized coiled-coil protein SlyX